MDRATRSRHVPLLGALLALLAASCGFFVPPAPDTTILVADINIDAVDFDPGTQTIYYLGTPGDSRARLSNEDGIQILASYDLDTGQTIVIDEGFTYRWDPWIGVGVGGELYVLDNGDHRSWRYGTEAEERLLHIYRDGVLDASHPVEWLEGDTCTAEVMDSRETSYLGVVTSDSDLKSTAEEAMHPKLLLQMDGGAIEAVYDPSRCEEEMFVGNLDRYLAKNLQALDQTTFHDTARDSEAILANEENQFRFLEGSKGFGYYNYSCEEVYDRVEFEDERYNLGSCIRAIHHFPSSGQLFTAEGALIYVTLGSLRLLEIR